MPTKTSPEYATLPDSTVVKYGPIGVAVTAMKALTNCRAIGATGQTGGYIECTTLLDTSKQFISDLPEGPEKSLVFIDNPEDADFAAFLAAAQKRETVQFYIELPNGRTATMILALSGWETNEISAPSNEVIQITVKGKQNTLTWGTKTTPPAGGGGGGKGGQGGGNGG